ncbi:hypothetical protein BFS06_14530 [Clostridium perfringens]|uniref:Uncharacterized protein n=1 Tax=Clostridium perfringens TaxID=1502 RepID=A0A140GRA1_CLOPF|nr:hypothetical protein [Clostridium perfringens]AMN31060.1 hypothetical protein JFP838_pA0144 [Clostridium perfringens]TBX14421.1 hypothetical protein BFS06_14530 [Clostridium perfringens]
MISFMPVMIAMIFSMIVYFILDKDKKITIKVCSYIPVRKSRKTLFLYSSMIVLIILIGCLDKTSWMFDILDGLFTGICIAIVINC